VKACGARIYSKRRENSYETLRRARQDQNVRASLAVHTPHDLLVLDRFFALLQVSCLSSSLEVSYKVSLGVLHRAWCVAVLANTRI
jgi:hypothetical protein